MRADLLRARSMACALARDLTAVLDSADRAVPFALTRLDDLLADDILRLWACLQGARDMRSRLTQRQITQMALSADLAPKALTPFMQAAA